jgi:Lon-like ATP-dependent protease
MDVVHIGSYTNLDKEHIFRDYLYSQAVEEAGLKKLESLFEIKPSVISHLINYYCRDPGIRSLQKSTVRIIETIVYEIAKAKEARLEVAEGADQPISSDFPTDQEKIVVDVTNLHKYIGLPIYDSDNMYGRMVVGVVKGLAYSEYGGSVLFVEASVGSIKKYSKGVKVTGSLGEVMKESIKIAYSYSRHFLQQLGNGFLEQYNVHIHVPEGATPKDGPSAGIAVTSALLSLSLNRPLSPDFAMTGEVSLKGKVLKIGGVKEKILSAKREGVRNVIVPFENKEDVADLPEDCKEGMTFHYVENYKEVFALLFPEPDASQTSQAIQKPLQDSVN